MSEAALAAAMAMLGAGDWDGAHRIVQDLESADAAWIHAHLHRVEGDLGNAAYWYRRAGRPIETGDLGEERTAITAVLS